MFFLNHEIRIMQKSFFSISSWLPITFGLLISILSFAQAPPEGINYQAIARDTNGRPISNSVNLKVKFTIWDSISGGSSVFSEPHIAVTTNRYGLFILVIGSVNTSGFTAIPWATGNKYLEVEIDTVGGNSYISMGRMQMMSVPYALYAKTAGNVNTSWSLGGNVGSGNNFIGTTNNAPLRFRTNNSPRMIIDSAGMVGIGTIAPGAMLDVAGQIKITGGAPGLGKFLTSDGAGLATWTSPTIPTYFPGSGLTLLGTTFNSVWTLSGSAIYNNNLGNVGIGTASPDSEFEVVSTSANGPHGIVGTQYNSSSVSDSHIWLRKASGTESSPAAIASGDEIGFLKFSGYNGAVFSSNDQTEIGAIASENFSATNNGSYLKFMTTPNGTINGAERMRIDQNGNVGIGTTGAPATKLEVDGTVNIAGSNTNELNRAQTGTANIVPIAYGNISSTGVVYASTGNITVTWENWPYFRYKISIASEYYTSSNYISVVTAIGGDVKAGTDDDGAGKLTVYIYDPSSNKVQNAFHFLVYKP